MDMGGHVNVGAWKRWFAGQAFTLTTCPVFNRKTINCLILHDLTILCMRLSSVVALAGISDRCALRQWSHWKDGQVSNRKTGEPDTRPTADTSCLSAWHAASFQHLPCVRLSSDKRRHRQTGNADNGNGGQGGCEISFPRSHRPIMEVVRVTRVTISRLSNGRTANLSRWTIWQQFIGYVVPQCHAKLVRLSRCRVYARRACPADARPTDTSAWWAAVPWVPQDDCPSASLPVNPPSRGPVLPAKKGRVGKV